jgi:sugar fermentation stimulation protein A
MIRMNQKAFILIQGRNSMKYTHVVHGKFVRRMNRFVAEVEIDGRLEAVHVKNTGRLMDLLVTGAKVYLEVTRNAARKHRYSIIAVEKDGTIVNIDSQAPNMVVYEAIRDGKVNELGEIRTLKREAVYGNSRFDLYFEGDGKKGFIEVKGVTLARDDTAMFPDAPTSRGTKHILELMEAANEGYEGVIFFLLQMKGCRRFIPNREMDGPFADALKEAVKNGIRVLVYDAQVSETTIEIGVPLAADIM